MQTTPSNRRGRRHFFGLVLLCAVLFFPSLPRVPFFNKGEPREALVVQDIYRHGSWLFPLRGGEAIPSKPPLFHWLAAAVSLGAGGVSEATVRFPSALLATLGVLVMYGLGRRFIDSESAFWGGVILATSVGYQSEAISARVDMTLSFCIALTLAVFYLVYRGALQGGLWRYALYLLFGVSVLAKGPVGLLLPGLIIWCFLAWRREWRLLREFCFHKGVILTLAVPLLWYGLALVRGGEDFFARQIIHENLARFFVHGEGGTGHQKPFYYYVPYLFLDGLPWSLFLPFMVYDGWRRRILAGEFPLFLALWAAVVFLFFSVSAGKRSAYLLPLFPPLALLLGSWMVDVARAGARPAELRLAGVVPLAMGLALLVAVGAVFMPARFAWVLSSLEEVLKPNDQIHLAAVRDALSRGGGWLAFAAVAFAGLWWTAAVELFRGRVRCAAASLAAVSIITAMGVQGALLPVVAAAKTYKPFMLEVNRKLGEAESLCLYGDKWDPTAVYFYRGAILEAPAGVADLERRLRSRSDFCIMSEREWKDLAAAGRAYPVVVTSGGGGPDGDDPIVLVRGK